MKKHDKQSLLVSLVFALLALILVLSTGCSTYIGRNDPNIQFSDQPHKEHPVTARQRYFSSSTRVADNWVLSRTMCLA